MRLNKLTTALITLGTLGLSACNGGSSASNPSVNTVTANQVTPQLFATSSCLTGKANFTGSGWYIGGNISISNNCASSVDLKGQTVSFTAQTTDGKAVTLGSSSVYANNTNYSLAFTSAGANKVSGAIDAAASWDGKNLNGTLEKGQTLTFAGGANTASGGTFDDSTANSSFSINGTTPPVVEKGELDVVLDTSAAGCSAGVACSDVKIAVTDASGQLIKNITVPVAQLGSSVTTQIKDVAVGNYTLSASNLGSDSISYTPNATPSVQANTTTVSTIKYTQPTPAVKTGAAKLSIASKVPNYTAALTVKILNSKDGNKVVNSYLIKQGASITTENLPISDASHAYVVSVAGIADPKAGLYYVESGLPTVVIKANTTTNLAIPFTKLAAANLVNLTLKTTGLQTSDSASLSFQDATNKYNYVSYTAQTNASVVYKVEKNLNLGYTMTAGLSNYKQNPLTATGVISAATTQNLVFAVATDPVVPPVGLNDWPNYLAMGTISNGVPTSEPTDQRIDSIFTYNGTGGDGDPGRIESPYKIYNMMTMGKAIRDKTGYAVNPSLVEYQWQLSGGWNPADVEDTDRLTKHFFNLMFLADTLQTQAPALTGTHGTILLSPDLLGFIGNTNRQADVEALKINVNQAVAQASCMMTKQVDFSQESSCTYAWNQQPITLNGTVRDLMPWLKTKTDNYTAGMAFVDCVGGAVVSKCANAVAPAGTPTFSSNFNGWVQAQNYLAKKYGPQVNLGWHENISGAPSGGWWVHGGATAVTPYANAVLADLQRFEVFSGKYKPDFIYLDRYGSDDYVGQMPSFHQQVHNQATFYNDQDWANIVQLSKQLSEGLAAGYGKAYVPVMLWQIPAAHIHTNTEQVVANVNDQEEGSAPVYFFGDPRLDSTLSNIAPWIDQGVGSLSETGYGLCKDKSASQCLTLNKFNWGHSDNAQLQQAADAHIFSILWGAGGFATGVWPVVGQTFYDGGWMANTVNTYYAKRLQKLN